MKFYLIQGNNVEMDLFATLLLLRHRQKHVFIVLTGGNWQK